MRLLFNSIAVIGLLIVPATSQASLLSTHCLEELDDAVLLFNKGNTSAAYTQFEQLAISCSQLPQIHHNLGVIAGIGQQWNRATEHFQRAIADDARTGMTHSHLQAIHQYKAAMAYRSALGTSGDIAQPQMSMQNSTHLNAVPEPLTKTTLHNVPTVDYELYSWWNAAATDELPAWLEHYSTGYPPQENTDANVVSWDDVGRNISFTAQDAVVVLSYQLNSIEKRTLLLLRLQNNRWKIYRESTL